MPLYNDRIMKGLSKVIAAIIILVVLVGLGFYFFQRQRPSEPPEVTIPETTQELPQKEEMELTSPAFEDNQSIPSKYTCDGEDTNPPLQITEVSEGTKSLVLIVDDPDAPAGTWVHWVVWNINPTITVIEENSVPEGSVQGMNDFEKQTYGGPCPPSGIHRYFFKLYALDTELSLPSSATKRDVMEAMEEHILNQAQLIGLYQRQE